MKEKYLLEISFSLIFNNFEEKEKSKNRTND